MRSTIILTSIVLAVTCHATELLDRNLAYMSPFVGFNEVRTTVIDRSVFASDLTYARSSRMILVRFKLIIFAMQRGK